MATQAPSILVKKCMLAVPGLANDKPLKSPVADQDLLRDKPTEDPDHKVISKARQSKLNTIGMADQLETSCPAAFLHEDLALLVQPKKKTNCQRMHPICSSKLLQELQKCIGSVPKEKIVELLMHYRQKHLLSYNQCIALLNTGKYVSDFSQPMQLGILSQNKEVEEKKLHHTKQNNEGKSKIGRSSKEYLRRKRLKVLQKIKEKIKKRQLMSDRHDSRSVIDTINRSDQNQNKPLQFVKSIDSVKTVRQGNPEQDIKYDTNKQIALIRESINSHSHQQPHFNSNQQRAGYDWSVFSRLPPIVCSLERAHEDNRQGQNIINLQISPSNPLCLKKPSVHSIALRKSQPKGPARVITDSLETRCPAVKQRSRRNQLSNSERYSGVDQIECQTKKKVYVAQQHSESSLLHLDSDKIAKRDPKKRQYAINCSCKGKKFHEKKMLQCFGWRRKEQKDIESIQQNSKLRSDRCQGQKANSPICLPYINNSERWYSINGSVMSEKYGRVTRQLSLDLRQSTGTEKGQACPQLINKKKQGANSGRHSFLRQRCQAKLRQNKRTRFDWQPWASTNEADQQTWQNAVGDNAMKPEN